MKKIFIMATACLLISGCGASQQATEAENDNQVGLANPASVFCLENGGELEMRESEEGEYGICKFADGSECEEWAFYRDECGEPKSEQNTTVVGNGFIKVFGIEENEVVSSPLTITGEAKAFENNLIVELRNSDHVSLVKEFTTIKSGEVGEVGPFEITLNFLFKGTKEGFIAIYEESAEDGEEVNLVEIPVKFGDGKSNNDNICLNKKYGFSLQFPKEWQACRVIYSERDSKFVANTNYDKYNTEMIINVSENIHADEDDFQKICEASQNCFKVGDIEIAEDVCGGAMDCVSIWIDNKELLVAWNVSSSQPLPEDFEEGVWSPTDHNITSEIFSEIIKSIKKVN